MAGIFFVRHKKLNDRKKTFKADILNSFKMSVHQQYAEYTDKRVWLCAIPKHQQTIEEVFYYDDKNELVVAVDGVCRVASEHHNKISRKLPWSSQEAHIRGISELYLRYKENCIDMLEGTFNIIIYNVAEDKLMCGNDIFGFYPMYYHETSMCIALSSRLEAIVASGLLNEIEFDVASFVEQLIFKYNLSDYSNIKDVRILPNASLLTVSMGNSSIARYWKIEDKLEKRSLNRTQSFELFDASLREACVKLMNLNNRSVNVSLTGGWDSRLVLSYLKKDFKDRISLYSFGAPNAPDITLPQQIAEREGLRYTPFMLDQSYLENEFETSAHHTVIQSEGARNFKRTHYVNTIEKISMDSSYLITGIFGDQIIKNGKPSGSTVVSKRIINLIESNFRPYNQLCMDLNEAAAIVEKYLGSNQQDIADSVLSRLDKTFESYRNHKNSSLSMFVFQFSINLRKYFGNEAASYKSNSYCLSPFIDKQFIHDYFLTVFAGFRHPFVSNNYLSKYKSTKLYADLIRKNCPSLLDYQTSRGYTMKDVYSAKGAISIFTKRKEKSPIKDAYNTFITERLFKKMAVNRFESIGLIEDSVNYIDDLLTLAYWKNYIESIYIDSRTL